MPTEGTGFLPHRAPAVRAAMNLVHYMRCKTNKITADPLFYFEEGGREKLERGSWPVDALKLARGQLRSARGALMARSSQRREETRDVIGGGSIWLAALIRASAGAPPMGLATS